MSINKLGARSEQANASGSFANLDMSIARTSLSNTGMLRVVATELVQSKADVIFALGGDVTPHAAKATQVPLPYID
jgi:hypothetical protein